MKVEKHISDLLFEHDCVIVPDLGGFVANYASAKIHPVQHTFTPPSKNIVFNKNLKNNDGLLANHIVTAEQTSYPQALRYISHFVENIQSEFKKGARVKIDEVGTLFLDVERNIQFEPGTTNFLLDTFGMSGFQSPAIKRDNITKRIEKEFKDRKAIPQERKKINVKRIVALSVVIPVLAAMVWIPLKTDLLKNINYSDLNPFASKEVKRPEFKKDIPKTIPIAIKKDTSATGVVDTTHSPVTATMIEPVKADSTAVKTATINPEFNFHLVAGCFMIEENAKNFVITLQQQNLNAAIIGKNNRGLYVVSCGDYATRKDALNNLDVLRKVQPNAWLYRN